MTSPQSPRLTRRAVGGLLFSGYAAAALAQSAEPVVTAEAGLTIEEVAYAAPDGFELPAYVARPQGPGPHPVVIVVSEIFGIHAYIEDVCRRLAHAGYAAIAPAFFLRAGDPAPLTDFAEIRTIVAAAGHEQVMGDVAATLDWLAARDWASDRIGVTGYCWGGAVTWMACARFAAIDAGVAWYGRLTPPSAEAGGGEDRPWPIDVADDLKAPVLGLYAGEDRGIPLESVEAMRAALEAADAPAAIVVYPDASHGFHADYRASYDAGSAADGWRRLLTHFETYLRG